MGKSQQYSQQPSLTSRIILYLLIMLVAQSIIVYGALHIFVALPHEWTGLSEDYEFYQKMLGESAKLLAEQFNGDPIHDQEVVNTIANRFNFNVEILPFGTELSSDVLAQFNGDNLAYDDRLNTLYLRYGPNDQLLQIGPLANNDILDADTSALLIFILVCSVVSALIFVCLLFMALLPLWRDAMRLRATAEQLTIGDLSARAPKAHSWLFKTLTEVVNTMADRLDQQVRNSKIIFHAMAHELRTPIARLRFGLTMMAESETKENFNRQLPGIHHDLEELEALINTSLNFFKMQQQDVLPKKHATDIVRWAHQLCDALIPMKPSHVQVTLAIEDVSFMLDTKLATLAVNNLLLNAFKYTSSRVKLAIFTVDDELHIAVSDDGAGIPKEAYDEIFRPFSRLDNSRTRETGGHGLGLAYVELIAKSHQGAIEVSESEWGGAKLTLILR